MGRKLFVHQHRPAAVRLPRRAPERAGGGGARRGVRRQLTTQLKPELDERAEDVRGHTVEALDVVCGFQARDSMRPQQGLDVDAAKAVVVHAVLQLLAARS